MQLITKKEAISKILSELVWENWPETPKGGQSCGIIARGFKCSHPDFNCEIKVCESRSMLENKNLVISLYELFLMEILKD